MKSDGTGPARWRCAWARPANPLLDIDQTAMDQRLRRNVEDPSVVAAAHGLLRDCETLARARPCEGRKTSREIVCRSGKSACHNRGAHAR